MEPQLSLRRLEVFRLVVDERSVTRAASLLMIAQPAVSSQLRALEEWLGARLFIRRGNQLILTEAGERTDAWARSILASAAELRRDVEGIESGRGGTAVAAASMGVGSYLMPGVLTRFREGHPDADITLNVVQPQEALRQITTGEADFAVTTWDADETRADIRSLILRDEPLVIVVRADLRPEGGSLTLEDALRLPLVGAPRVVAAQRSMISQLRRLSDTEPTFVIRLGHALSTKQAVVDHGWAAILPRYVVDADVASGVLATVHVPGLDLQERIVLVWRPDKVFSKLQQRLMGEIRRELGAESEETSDALNI
ncbi:LysR family transcriptional regulator [Acrocarpospora pleiomorpha]|uniref:LysR family transcriptional regulator n=1 Tax=Acrocarpospora pleiomorpha TaxID=90975 RepID=A0A5M3XDI3_9ACTN|nr:LysR family transcriptional regulator [Acrocarpospora pleiomorpha]GES19667.1 LysR family transcriptional regulator [Acrocarpospora pleiomorpha]